MKQNTNYFLLMTCFKVSKPLWVRDTCYLSNNEVLEFRFYPSRHSNSELKILKIFGVQQTLGGVLRDLDRHCQTFLSILHSPAPYNCNVLVNPFSPVVTVCTTRFMTQKFSVLLSNCIYVFCMGLRTNSDYLPI